jgi:hypothetical protein
LTTFPPRTRRGVPQQIPQQWIEKRGIKRLPFNSALGIDSNHSWGDPLNGIGYKAVLQSLHGCSITHQAGHCQQHYQQLTQGVPQHQDRRIDFFLSDPALEAGVGTDRSQSRNAYCNQRTSLKNPAKSQTNAVFACVHFWLQRQRCLPWLAQLP